MAIISGYPTVTPSSSDHILGTQVEPITLEIRTVQFTIGSISGTGGQVNSLTTTGTGAATLISNVLNIPTPVIPTVPFTSLTTTGTSGASTLTSGVLNIPQYAGGMTSFIVSDSETTPNTTTISNADTVTFAGTANQLSVIENAGTLTFSFPTNVITNPGGGSLTTRQIFSESIFPNATGVYALGSDSIFGTKRWKVLFVDTISDSSQSLGTAGQVLSSTGTGLSWINASSATSLNGLTDCLIDTASEYVGTVPANLSGNPQGNTTLGIGAGLGLTTGGSNVFIGRSAGGSITASNRNVAIGALALASGSSNVIDGNVAIGYRALTASNTGDHFNVALGYDAGLSVLTGGSNVLLGAQAGDALTTGGGNVIVGKSADTSAPGSSNEIIIGGFAVGHGANIAVIGNTSITAWHPGDDNGVDLGSTAYSFKDSYVQGTSNAGGFKVDAMQAAPSDSGDTGAVGDIRFTSSAIYVCVAADTWKKADINTF